MLVTLAAPVFVPICSPVARSTSDSVVDTWYVSTASPHTSMGSRCWIVPDTAMAMLLLLSAPAEFQLDPTAPYRYVSTGGSGANTSVRSPSAHVRFTSCTAVAVIR